MSEFIVTPTNVDLLESLFRNPITGKWTIPFLTFNTGYKNPYFAESDPLNDDPRYQQEVIDHFYIRLKEKWLYHSPLFKSLLKYFKIEKKDNEGKVSLITRIDEKPDEKLNQEHQKYIFKYIEKFFITRRFVEKALKQYINTTHVKWYDLYNNTDIVKDLLRHKLKRLIKRTIYELQYASEKKD